MSSTKLIVLKSKELIYTAILLILIIVFIVIIIFMFKDKNNKAEKKKSVTASAKASTVFYNDGTYNAPLILGDSTLSVNVTVNEGYIAEVSIKQLDESITTMYPLLETSLEEINTQLHYISSVDDIVPSSDNTYTTKLLIASVKEALSTAVVQ